MKMKKVFLSLLFMGCASPLLQNPALTAGAGAVGAEVVKKVVDSAPKFNPYLKINEFEVCILNKTDNTKIDCTLVLSHEKRTLEKDRISEDDTVFIKKESLLYLMSELEVFCKHEPDSCKEAAKDYKSIKRVFIF